MHIRTLRTNALRAALLASLGSVAAATQGCDDGTGTGGAGGAGSTTGSSSGKTTSTGTGSTSTATGTTTSGTSTASGSGSGSTSASTGTGMANVERCFPGSVGTACPAADMAEATFGFCTSTGEKVLAWISGPIANGTDCCYQVDVTDPGDPACGVIGRPLVVEQVARRATLDQRESGWNAAGLEPATDALDEGTRLALAGAWADDAAFEHASVAAFSKTALELVALGAPRDLVEGCHRAALDEITHASMGFALASAYAGAPRAPSRFPDAVRAAFATDLVTLAVAAVEEGCVGETLAALVAGAQRDAATDVAVKTALVQIAADEARHAELSYAIVAWAIREGGDVVRRAVASAFDAQLEKERAAIAIARALPRADHADVLEAHGRLDPSEVAREKARGIEDVVLPAMRALLG